MKYRHVLDQLSPTLQLQLVTGGTSSTGTSQVLQPLPCVPLLTDFQAFLPAQRVSNCKLHKKLSPRRLEAQITEFACM